MVTKGYHNNPEANQSSFTADGWFRTGDILKMEGDLLYMVDRKKASTEIMIYYGKHDKYLTRDITGVDQIQRISSCASGA